MATSLIDHPDDATTTYTQPTATPTAKVKAVGFAGLAVGAIVTLLTLAGVTIPDGLSAQAEQAVSAVLILVSFGQALVQFVAGYLKKSDTANGAKK